MSNSIFSATLSGDPLSNPPTRPPLLTSQKANWKRQTRSFDRTHPPCDVPLPVPNQFVGSTSPAGNRHTSAATSLRFLHNTGSVALSSIKSASILRIINRKISSISILTDNSSSSSAVNGSSNNHHDKKCQTSASATTPSNTTRTFLIKRRISHDASTVIGGLSSVVKPRFGVPRRKSERDSSLRGPREKLCSTSTFPKSLPLISPHSQSTLNLPSHTSSNKAAEVSEKKDIIIDREDKSNVTAVNEISNHKDDNGSNENAKCSTSRRFSLTREYRRCISGDISTSSSLSPFCYKLPPHPALRPLLYTRSFRIQNGDKVAMHKLLQPRDEPRILMIRRKPMLIQVNHSQESSCNDVSLPLPVSLSQNSNAPSTLTTTPDTATTAATGKPASETGTNLALALTLGPESLVKTVSDSGLASVSKSMSETEATSVRDSCLLESPDCHFIPAKTSQPIPVSSPVTVSLSRSVSVSPPPAQRFSSAAHSGRPIIQTDTRASNTITAAALTDGWAATASKLTSPPSPSSSHRSYDLANRSNEIYSRCKEHMHHSHFSLPALFTISDSMVNLSHSRKAFAQFPSSSPSNTVSISPRHHNLTQNASNDKLPHSSSSSISSRSNPFCLIAAALPTDIQWSVSSSSNSSLSSSSSALSTSNLPSTICRSKSTQHHPPSTSHLPLDIMSFTTPRRCPSTSSSWFNRDKNPSFSTTLSLCGDHTTSPSSKLTSTPHPLKILRASPPSPSKLSTPDPNHLSPTSSYHTPSPTSNALDLRHDKNPSEPFSISPTAKLSFAIPLSHPSRSLSTGRNRLRKVRYRALSNPLTPKASPSSASWMNRSIDLSPNTPPPRPIMLSADVQAVNSPTPVVIPTSDDYYLTSAKRSTSQITSPLSDKTVNRAASTRLRSRPPIVNTNSSMGVRSLSISSPPPPSLPLSATSPHIASVLTTSAPQIPAFATNSFGRSFSRLSFGGYSPNSSSNERHRSVSRSPNTTTAFSRYGTSIYSPKQVTGESDLLSPRQWISRRGADLVTWARRLSLSMKEKEDGSCGLVGGAGPSSPTSVSTIGGGIGAVSGDDVIATPSPSAADIEAMEKMRESVRAAGERTRILLMRRRREHELFERTGYIVPLDGSLSPHSGVSNENTPHDSGPFIVTSTPCPDFKKRDPPPSPLDTVRQASHSRSRSHSHTFTAAPRHSLSRSHSHTDSVSECDSNDPSTIVFHDAFSRPSDLHSARRSILDLWMRFDQEAAGRS